MSQCITIPIHSDHTHCVSSHPTRRLLPATHTTGSQFQNKCHSFRCTVCFQLSSLANNSAQPHTFGKCTSTYNSSISNTTPTIYTSKVLENLPTALTEVWGPGWYFVVLGAIKSWSEHGLLREISDSVNTQWAFFYPLFFSWKPHTALVQLFGIFRTPIWTGHCDCQVPSVFKQARKPPIWDDDFGVSM